MTEVYIVHGCNYADNVLTDFIRFLIPFISDVKCDSDELDRSVVTDYEQLAFRKTEDDSRNSHREHSKTHNKNTAGSDRGGLSWACNTR